MRTSQDLVKVTISVDGFQELQKMQRGIIHLLSKVEIEDCNTEVKEEIRLIYKLLLLLHEHVPLKSKTDQT